MNVELTKCVKGTLYVCLAFLSNKSGNRYIYIYILIKTDVMPLCHLFWDGLWASASTDRKPRVSVAVLWIRNKSTKSFWKAKRATASLFLTEKDIAEDKQDL